MVVVRPGHSGPAFFRVDGPRKGSTVYPIPRKGQWEKGGGQVVCLPVVTNGYLHRSLFVVDFEVS